MMTTQKALRKKNHLHHFREGNLSPVAWNSYYRHVPGGNILFLLALFPDPTFGVFDYDATRHHYAAENPIDILESKP